MNRLIIRVENHWRVWRTTRRRLFEFTVFGITVFGIRVDRKYVGVEVFGVDVIAYLAGDNNSDNLG